MGDWLQNVRLLTVGSLFFLAAGIFVVIYLPSLDPQGYTPTALAHPYTEIELRGREIFKREGCWYCHTQQVRPPEANLGTIHLKGDIGAASEAGERHSNPHFHVRYAEHRATFSIETGELAALRTRLIHCHETHVT